MLPAELFANLASRVFVVQSLDGHGGILSFGSGVVVLPGHVVTNKHVVKGAVAIKVKHGNSTWPSKVTHVDPNHDICQLLVDNLGVPPVQVRQYSSLSVGERVYAIGSPQGFDLTLSEGLISGLRRRGGTNVIQTTAPISRGSSGGGLFDSEGRLIGITTYFIEEGQSLNFAISADLALTLGSHPFIEQSKVLGDDSESDVFELARREFHRGKYGDAIKLYREALKLRPQSEEAWCNLGICYSKVGLYEDSIEACREALRLKPEFLDAWTWLGLEYSRMKQFDKAIEAFKEVNRFDPNNALGWAGLGDAYRGMRSREEALAAYKEAIRLDPQADFVWNSVGRLHLDGNLYNDAISAFREALRLEPEKAMNWYYLGVAYYHQGDREKQFQVLQRLMELDPQKAREFDRDYASRWDRSGWRS